MLKSDEKASALPRLAQGQTNGVQLWYDSRQEGVQGFWSLYLYIFFGNSLIKSIKHIIDFRRMNPNMSADKHSLGV